MNKARTHVPLSAALFASLFIASNAMSQTDRYWTTPTGWWWLTGANSSEIASRVNAGFRPFSLERTPTGTYNALFVQNSGAYAKAGTALYYGQTDSSLGTPLNNNNQRLLDLHVYDAGRGVTNMAAIAIPNSGADAAGWGRLYNTTPTAIGNWLSTATRRCA